MYFASYRELTGVSEEEIRMAEGSSMCSLMNAVEERHEPLRDVGRKLIALNGDFAEPSSVLKDGDVVALFPPVSGG
jgi:molybdopterin synthase sulfur carrier subunit